MPGMSGYTTCQKTRKKHLASELPIIMLTAKNQITDLVEGFNVGANDFLTKPFSKMLLHLGYLELIVFSQQLLHHF